MAQLAPRDQLAGSASAAEGWALSRVTRPSRLNGANGLRTGKDGRIYVAQVAGSQVSAVDPDTGAIETFSAMGAGIVGPDDLVFDDEGNLYCTEITEGRVSMMRPDGTCTVIQGDMPVSNPITLHQGMLIAGECRHGGRIMELDRNGGAPRIILDDAPSPNAFEVGPDGKLYFPAMSTNEIWKLDLQTGATEIVAKDLGLPDSVKFDKDGMIVSTQVASGQVLRIDPRTGAREVLADVGAGLDNCTFVGDRLFVSHITGALFEVLGGGVAKPLVEKGLQWPLGLAVNGNGSLFVADGGFTYVMPAGGGALELQGMLFTPGFPGFSRGVAVSAPGEYVVTTANGQVSRWRPAEQAHEVLADGLEQGMGVAIAPGGAVIAADGAMGRVIAIENGNVSELASGLSEPRGVAISPEGTIYVAEKGAGRVVSVSGGKAQTLVDGLGAPEGIALHGGKLYAVDTAGKQVLEYDLASRGLRPIASGLPVGTPAGVNAPPLRSFMPLCGAMTSMTGIAAAADGTIYVSGDMEGSVLAIRPA